MKKIVKPLLPLLLACSTLVIVGLVFFGFSPMVDAATTSEPDQPSAPTLQQSS